MADCHGVMGKRSVGYRRRSMREEDFEEEEVWSVMKDTQDSISTRNSKNYYSSYDASSSSSSSSAWRLPDSAPRMIPRTTAIGTSTSTSSHEAKITKAVQLQQSSAPVKIPDWSKIYGRNVARMGTWENIEQDHDDVDDGDDDDEEEYYHNDDVNDDGDGDGDDNDDGMVPPHEWIARKLARSQISSFSMCEGIGRTLKGRDLSKVRNAVLSKTGFLE